MAKKTDTRNVAEKEHTHHVSTHTSTRERIQEAIMTNLKPIGIGIIAILIIALIGVAWNAYQQSTRADALELEGEAFALYQNIQTEEESANEAPRGEEETADSAVGAKNPYQPVLNIYQQLLEEYSGTDSAERALYLMGTLEYNSGNYEQALEHFTEYVSRYSSGKMLIPVKKSVGYIFEQKGDYQKAIEQFQTLLPQVSSVEKAQLLLAIGRNYALLEKYDEAITTYQEIVNSNTSATWKEDAMERLAVLGADVAPVAEEDSSPKEESSSEEDAAASDNS